MAQIHPRAAESAHRVNDANTHMTASRQNFVSALRSRTAPLAKTGLLRMGGYAALRRLLPSRRVAILRYHAVCRDEGYRYADPSISISPEAFEHHVGYLASNYTVLPLAEVVERFAARRPLPPNVVVITFDDGYADNLLAARTLHRHQLSATFFITAGCLAGGDPFWLSEIRALILGAPDGPLTLSADGATLSAALSDASSRAKAIRSLTRLIKSHPIATRETLRQQLRQAAPSAQLVEPMLRWEDVVEMRRLGMTIGAHTVTHPNLPSAGLSAAREEIAGSKQRLEHQLGEPITLFSYPNGGAERYYTEDLQKVVADCGFRAATTSRNGFAHPGSDLYALERIEVEERLEDLVFALEVERFVFAPTP
jgi:peptidoglycan/xylan/chitin deacetylase (PgdA/CDA1 family)